MPQRHRRTDGQTDRRTTCHGNTALRVASRGKNLPWWPVPAYASISLTRSTTKLRGQSAITRFSYVNMAYLAEIISLYNSLIENCQNLCSKCAPRALHGRLDDDATGG